jgi:ketol-acid reductoisomerase
VLDLAVEQALSPALRRVSTSFTQVMLEHGIPLEAVITELVLSGEIERTYRLMRIEGYAAQMEHHSPTSQYGQLSRAEEFGHLDVASKMREIVDGISSGRFADEWDAERDAGYPNYERLKAAAVGPEAAQFDRELRERLGQGATTAS